MAALLITPEGVLTENTLTSREKEVLGLLAEGLQQKLIAEKLNITSETVKKHLKHIYKKLGAHNKVEALRRGGWL